MYINGMAKEFQSYFYSDFEDTVISMGGECIVGYQYGDYLVVDSINKTVEINLLLQSEGSFNINKLLKFNQHTPLLIKTQVENSLSEKAEITYFSEKAKIKGVVHKYSTTDLPKIKVVLEWEGKIECFIRSSHAI